MQAVFYLAHRRQGGYFHLSDLLIVSQAIVAGADYFATSDGGLRRGLEQLRQDKQFRDLLASVGAGNLVVPKPVKVIP